MNCIYTSTKVKQHPIFSSQIYGIVAIKLSKTPVRVD